MLRFSLNSAGSWPTAGRGAMPLIRAFMDSLIPMTALITQCTQLVLKAREMGSAYGPAAQTLDAIANECSILITSLEKIQMIPREQLEADDLQRDLGCVLDECHVILETIWEVVQTLDSELAMPSSSSWTMTLTRKVRIRSIWDGKAMVGYLERLRSEHSFLKSLFLPNSSEPMDRTHTSMERLRPNLAKKTADTASLISQRRTKRPEPPATGAQPNETPSHNRLSILSDLASPLYADHGRYPRLSQYMPAIDEAAEQTSQDLPTRRAASQDYSSHNPRNDALSRVASLRSRKERPLPSLPNAEQNPGAKNPYGSYRLSHPIRPGSASTMSTSSGTTGRSSSNHTAHPDDFSSPVNFTSASGLHSDIFSFAGLEPDEETPAASARKPLRRRKSILSSITRRWSNTPSVSIDPKMLPVIQELNDMAGPSHVGTVAKALERHDIDTVFSWFQQIRGFGSGDHFHIALIALRRRDFDIVYVGETLKQLRALGEEPDYGYVMKYLQIHTYDIAEASQVFRTLKGLFSTPQAYTSVLMLLERYQFNYEAMIGDIRSISASAMGGTQTYCDLIAFIAYRDFNMQVTGKEFAELMAANWTQTALGPKPVAVTQDVLLRETVTLKLLGRNSYDVRLTISQVDSLCGEENSENRQKPGVLTRKKITAKRPLRTLGDVSSASLDTGVLSFDRSTFMTTATYREAAMFVGLLPDRPRLPLKVLQKANYDYFDALDGIQWLKPITKTTHNFRKAVEQGDYDLQKLRSSHDKMCKLIGASAEQMYFVDNSISAHGWDFGKTLELYDRLHGITQRPVELKLLLEALIALKWNEARLMALLGDPVDQNWARILIHKSTLLEDLAALQTLCNYEDKTLDKIVGKLLRDVDNCELPRVNQDLSRLKRLSGAQSTFLSHLRMLEYRQLQVGDVEQDCRRLREYLGHHGGDLYDFILQILEKCDFDLELLISDCRSIADSIRYAVGTTPGTSKIYKAAILSARHFEYNLTEVLQGLRYIGSHIEEPRLDLYAFTVAVVYKSGKRFEQALETLEIIMGGGETPRAAFDLWKISYAKEVGAL